MTRNTTFCSKPPTSRYETVSLDWEDKEQRSFRKEKRSECTVWVLEKAESCPCSIIRGNEDNRKPWICPQRARGKISGGGES